MNSTLRRFALVATLSSFSPLLIAGTCEMVVTRTACPGQEAISYKKCDGEASCSEFKEVASAAECGAEATAACENKRLNITKSKVITANFDGAAVKTAGGGDDFCMEYAKRDAEFNKCD